MFQYFDDAVFSCNVGLLKPDKQMYVLAMQRLNVLLEQCLFVRDGDSDELYGAKSANIGTVFETKSIEQREAIMKNADDLIKHINELLYCM